MSDQHWKCSRELNAIQNYDYLLDCQDWIGKFDLEDLTNFDLVSDDQLEGVERKRKVNKWNYSLDKSFFF